MRGVLALVVVVLVLALVGWISFDRTPERSSINIETEQIQDDTSEAVERGEELIESGRRAITDDDDAVDTGEVDTTEPISTDRNID